MPVPLSHPKLHALIHNNKLHQALVRQMAAVLPDDDASLDALIGESVANHDGKAFNYLVITALSKKRPVDARHLAGGVQLMMDTHWLCILSWKMQGDVAEHLITAVATTVITRELAATSLLLATTWSQQFREGRLPEKLVRLAREMARDPEANGYQIALLWRIAQLLDDADLTAILRTAHPLPEKAGSHELPGKTSDAILALRDLMVFACVPEKPENLIASGPHLRRAAARVGRNDPCPCGSGMKFKKCCEGKDERMRQLSTVQGKTFAEVAAEPEPHLTEARLAGLKIYEVAQLDVTKLPPSLHVPYLMALERGLFFEEMATAFERLGCTGAEMEAAWDHIIQSAAMKQRLDIARRLIKVRYSDGAVPENIYFRVRLLLASEDPVRYAELMEEQAKLVLTSGDHAVMMEYGYALLHSKYPFTGIHCARGLVPLIGKRYASQLLYFVELSRDRLNLPPEEPMAEILEKRFAEELVDRGKDAVELLKARERLDAKIGEVNELKENLEKLRREIRLQEKKAPKATSTQTAAEPKELRDLREKVRGLKSSITARNEERAMFRRELGQAYADLQALRAQKAAEPAGNDAPVATSVDAEDALLLPGDIDSNQPPRPIEFPKKFNDTLASLPRQIGRAALIHIGRIAAGDPTAFAGAIRLKAAPDVMRVRIGQDHRMLFRLLPECVQLVSLINRRDLERTIESL